MSNFAARLMMQDNQTQQPALPAAIFGSAGSVSHSLQINATPVRIGFWPIKSTGNPEEAMGLLVTLGYLLERYQGVRVYRILAHVGDQPESFVWHMEQSQFEVDEWQVENLDDNVGIWGVLDGSRLTFEIESDLKEDEDTHILSYSADSLAGLVRLLPQAAADIAAWLDTTELNLVAPVYESDDWGDAVLADLLKKVFHWERQLYLWLWGQEWANENILTDAAGLLASARPLANLGAWLVSHATARMIIFMGVEDEFLLPAAQNIIDAFADHPSPTIILAGALYEAKYPQQAYDWFEAAFDEGRAGSLTFLAAAELYRRGGQITDAVDVMQAAIEDQVADALLFRRYGDLLVALEYNGLSVDEFVLIDRARRSENDLLREAVEAYEQASSLNPEDASTLSRQMLQMLEAGGYEKRIWQGFERLAGLDKTGDHLRMVIDMLHSLEDSSPAVDILKRHIRQSPDRIYLYLNLAAVCILEDDGSAALEWLNQARRMTTDEALIAEIERLRLAAENPEFEMTLGEITDIIGAGNKIETDDVEFLENIIEQAPTYVDAYLLLAHAYAGWGEPSAALETLLDGHKHNSDDPDLLTLISELMWDSGETDLAFSYLHKGISRNPLHVPLLALAGQYLFEDGQEEAAKAYLIKAEAISPNDPTLNKVRRHIARSMR